MNEVFFYLLKVLTIQGTFFLAYYLILKRSGRHSLNRYYLLGSIIIAFVIPFITISNPVKLNYESNETQTMTWVKAPSQVLDHFELVPVENSSKFSLSALLPYCWGIVSIVLVIRSIFYVCVLNSIRSKSERIPRKWYTIYKTTLKNPFSFFSSVFIPGSLFESTSFSQLLLHECVHVRQLHSLDRLLLDFLISLFWFNPFIYLYRNALIAIHEYQADEAVIRHFKDPVSYQEVLFSQLQKQKYTGLVSHFNVELIKKRIVMMNRKNKLSVWLYAISAPITLLLIFAFSSSKTMRPQEGVETEFVGPFKNLSELTQTSHQNDNVPSILPIKSDENVRLVSRFGMRIHPVLKVEKMHLGIDLSCKEDSEIIATANGIVELLETQVGGYGKQIVINHGNGFKTRYAQLSSFEVKVGELVQKGQLIALAGNGSSSTTPHLHYEIEKGDRRVDPMEYVKN